MGKRKVEWYEYERNSGKVESVFQGTALFHEFGVDYEEFESGHGNYSTAIIELPDGTIKNVYVTCIQFIDK